MADADAEQSWFGGMFVLRIITTEKPKSGSLEDVLEAMKAGDCVYDFGCVFSECGNQYLMRTVAKTFGLDFREAGIPDGE